MSYLFNFNKINRNNTKSQKELTKISKLLNVENDELLKLKEKEASLLKSMKSK